MAKHRIDWDRVAWTPFEVATNHRVRPGDEAITEVARRSSVTLVNAIYQVEVKKMRCPPPLGDVIWLSFKTRDKRARHDWREMQRLKNELVGEHVEAVELFPDEDRLVDTSNQFHLWCFPWCAFEGHPVGRLPIGWNERIVAEGSDDGSASGPGARQRPFKEGEKPSDCLDPLRLRALGLHAPGEALRGRCPFCGAGFQRQDDGSYRCVAEGHEVRP